MGLWNKLFGSPAATQAKGPSAAPQGSKEPTAAPDNGSSASTAAEPKLDASKTLWLVKLPRYAHLAKRHELRGEFGEAELNYFALAQAIERALGGDHPDLATTLHEIASLNKHNIVTHAPQIQGIFDQLGRAAQVQVFYEQAMQIRRAKLGIKHPAYAQSLFALATCYHDSGDRRESDKASAMLEEAVVIQKAVSDRLSSALSMTYLGELQTDSGKAKELFDEALKYIPAQGLQTLEVVAEICDGVPNVSDLGKREEMVKQVQELQAPLADPYFEMCLRLLSDGDSRLLLDGLNLQRRQYRRNYLETRARLLTNLADIADRQEDLATAGRLNAEAHEIEDMLSKEQAD